MSASTEQRKLAAIIPLCGTDMVGYSALSQRNERLALRSVPEGRQRIAQRFIAGWDGRTGKVPQGRKKIAWVGRRVDVALSPLWGLTAFCRTPSDKSLGYSLSLLRGWVPTRLRRGL